MEKWRIKITEENEEEVGKYYNMSTQTDTYDEEWVSYYFRSHNNRGVYIVGPGYKHASFALSKSKPSELRVIEIEEFRRLTTQLNYEIY